MAANLALSAAERLRLALDERDVSIRALAIALTEEGASRQRLDNVRGQIYDWLNGQKLSDRNAERVARALGYPADYFKTSRPARGQAAAVSREEFEERGLALQELEETVAKLSRTVASLRRRIALLEQRPHGEGRGTAAEGSPE